MENQVFVKFTKNREHFVDSLKRGLKKLGKGESPTLHHLQTFHSVYRSTPNRNTP